MRIESVGWIKRAKSYQMIVFLYFEFVTGCCYFMMSQKVPQWIAITMKSSFCHEGEMKRKESEETSEKDFAAL
jgi:hypothetical protein